MLSRKCCFHFEFVCLRSFSHAVALDPRLQMELESLANNAPPEGGFISPRLRFERLDKKQQKELDFRKDGDWTMETAEAKAARKALRKSEAVLKWINVFWRFASSFLVICSALV